MAKVASKYSMISALAADYISYVNGDITGKHLGANMFMTALGLLGGPPGAAAAIAYWGLEAFYDGGAPQAFYDLAGIVDRAILE